jgi:hypothetical protein
VPTSMIRTATEIEVLTIKGLVFYRRSSDRIDFRRQLAAK